MTLRFVGAWLVAWVCVGPATVAGDTEVAPRAYVRSSGTDGTAYRGDRYAKCLPPDRRHPLGRTVVYRVRADADEVEDAYDWYADEVYLAGTGAATLVARVSAGFRGDRPRAEDLAVGFYARGKPLKEYAAPALCARGDVEVSVSHYRWCRRVIGYCWLTAPHATVLKFGFALETVDRRLLCFDARTGELADGWRPEQNDATPH